MKTYLPVILGVIVLSMLGAGAFRLHSKKAGISDSDNSKPGLYQNDTYNFCIRYPENYTLTTLPEGMNPPAVLSLRISASSSPSTGHDPETDAGIDSMHSMLMMLNTPASMDLHAHVSAIIPEEFLISEKDTSINGLSAIEVKGRSAFDGTHYKTMYVFLPASGNVKDSLLTASYDDETAYTVKFDDAVLSIQRKDPGTDCN